MAVYVNMHIFLSAYLYMSTNQPVVLLFTHLPVRVHWLGSDTAWLSRAWVLHPQGLGLNPGSAN